MGVFAIIVLAYANHFHNGFHFDDNHTIVNNPWIRQLDSIPGFFTDATTFSMAEKGRVYRPFVSTSLAIDYWLGGGLQPLYFHASTFFWFLAELAVLFTLMLAALERISPGQWNFYIALFSAALYGAHPAIAETVNYIVQRGDLYASLGVLAALAVYVRWPGLRKLGIYLLPALAGIFSKPPALIFPILLLLWLLCIEETPWREALRNSIPAFLATGAAALFTWRMTPSSFDPGAGSVWAYRMTQPAVLFHYFQQFFAPLRLSADSDRTAFPSALAPEALAGFAFLATLGVSIWWCLRRKELRLIAYGLGWFLVASLPTSLFALADLENDHRMSFPFLGLTIAVCHALALVASRLGLDMKLGACVCAFVLLGMAWGTHQRNEVWKTDESLWRDATLKSPLNRRAWMNYGVSLMQKGDFAAGLTAFEAQQALGPSVPEHDSLLEVNLGKAFGSLANEREARNHFERAISLWPGATIPRMEYAVWLHQAAFDEDSAAQLKAILATYPDTREARLLLSDIYVARSGASGRAGTYQDCVTIAKEAVRLNEESPKAWNNVAACQASLGDLDNAISSAQSAIRLAPNWEIPRAILASAVERKQQFGARISPLPSKSTVP